MFNFVVFKSLGCLR